MSQTLTQLQSNQVARFSSRKVVQLGVFTALALMIHVLEAPLPRPLPWLKLGLSNIIPLVLIHLMGVGEALVVTFLRTLLGAFILGSFLSPGFILSFCGGLMSTLMMGLAYRSLYPKLTLIGISVSGALIHNITQLLIAYWLFFQTLHLGDLSLIMLLPLLITSAIPAGILVGYLGSAVCLRLKEDF